MVDLSCSSLVSHQIGTDIPHSPQLKLLMCVSITLIVTHAL
jgi:hypothetical protein